MIWSVSTAERFSATATPVWVVNFSMSGLHLLARGQVGRTGEAPHDGGGGRDQRRHQVRAAALALTALEIAVARGGAALARCELVGVHSQAHRAPREPPLRAELLEDLVEPFRFGLQSHPG